MGRHRAPPPPRSASSRVGRPFIGPKVQTNARQEICDYIVARAAELGVNEADVIREMLEDSFSRTGARVG